ncbi:hypothetical protein F4777DRAFT_539843 [Nemania sp. FL0916]|nr:hypothetical protein F4777DRAFT_539843 [Nemania sp. FL0916]
MISELLLEENFLSISELYCFLVMTSFSFFYKTASEHKIVPVTMISVSGHHLRIIQGYVDGEKGIVELRKTRIVYMGTGGLANMKRHSYEWITCMRWILARPIGKTT